MSERQLQTAVIELAQFLAWRVAHFRPAQTSKGWRTPVEADGAGFPDLVCVRGERLIFVELKSAKGTLRPDQEHWVRALRGAAGVEMFVWTPNRWLDGTIEQVLR